MAAAGGNHLSNGRVNVGLLRECARRELLQCLNKQPGSKVTRKFLYLHVTCKLQYFKSRFMMGVLEWGKPENANFLCFLSVLWRREIENPNPFNMGLRLQAYSLDPRGQIYFGPSRIPNL